MKRPPIPIDILHAETCGNWQVTAAADWRVAVEVDEAVAVSDIVIDTPETARALRFPGSPTIRVRGRALQPEAEERGDGALVP